MSNLKPLATVFTDVIAIAREAISVPAREAVVCYLLTQQNEDGGFAGRDGRSDVYYTMFGALMTYAFELKVDVEPLQNYLKSIAPDTLDAVHRAAYLNGRLLAEMLSFSFIRQRTAFKFFPNSFIFKRRFAQPMQAMFRPYPLQKTDYPNLDPHAPYAQFMTLFSQQAMACDIPGEGFDAYRTKEGFYSNLKGGSYNANATACALIVNCYNGIRDVDMAQRLAQKQNKDGSFSAHDPLHEGDLLSTATVLFALYMLGVKSQYSTKEFLRECFRSEGGFAASPTDNCVDLEYTFYGFLCMGICA